LVQALQSYLTAMGHLVQDRIELAEQAYAEGVERERAAQGERRAWVRSDEARLSVFDRRTGQSRYDPRPPLTMTVRLACPSKTCHAVASYSFSPHFATHRIECAQCKAPFSAYFAEVREVAVTTPRRGHRLYAFRLEELDGTFSRLEFEDTSAGELTAARRDLMAFLYGPEQHLRGVLNLSTGRVLWLQSAGPCFLMTAVFGEGAPELDAFRGYRDQVLSRSVLGAAAVRGYYRLGPALSAWVTKRPHVRAAVRAMAEQVHRWLRRKGYR
jgi:hypothetical protein